MLVATLLVLSGCGSNQAPTLPNDGPAPAFSRAAALRFVQKALTAGQTAVEDQAFTLTLTDAEVTSFLNIRTELTREMRELGMNQLDQLEGLEGLTGEGFPVENINPDAWVGLLGGDDEEGQGLLPRLRLGLKDPRVHFRENGHVVGRGDLAFLRWRLPVRLVVAPHATSGEMVLDFVEGQAGRLKLPEFVFDLLGKGIAEALLAGQAYAEITQIRVGMGTFTISGRYNR
ncbi:MAG: hypothetical protein JXC32_20860 [Anaerolineae bacterium]|nr:hypothetical protein [Anaerolineae bacterium]